MWRKLGLVSLLVLSNHLFAGEIELTMRAEKESTVNVNGEILTVRQPVKRINVGDVLTIVLNYSNNSPDDTFNIHIDNPIPAGTRFVLGSGFGKDATFLVSYDGGVSYVDDIHINKKSPMYVGFLTRCPRTKQVRSALS